MYSPIKMWIDGSLIAESSGPGFAALLGSNFSLHFNTWCVLLFYISPVGLVQFDTPFHSNVKQPSSQNKQYDKKASFKVIKIYVTIFMLVCIQNEGIRHRNL